MKKFKKFIFMTSIIAMFSFCFNSVYAEEILAGDLNNDGKISTTDLSMFKGHIVGISEIANKDILKFADINHDGKISMADLSLLRSKLIGVAEEFLKSQHEDVIKYLEGHADFISDYNFKDLSEFDLTPDGDFLKNYLYGNSINDLNISTNELIEIGESLGYNLDKIKNLNLPLINMNYLYNDSLLKLVFKMDATKKLITSLGYNADEVYDYIQKSTPYISSIQAIKDNYFDLFGEEIPESVITEIKKSKNYLKEYDAIFYTKARKSSTKYTVNNITGEIVDNTFKLVINDEKLKANITLNRGDNDYYFVSVEKTDAEKADVK